VPSGVEPLVGLDWLTFLSNTGTPSELVEFVAVGSEVHNATVDLGSAAAGDDPGILAVYPNNAPDDQWSVVTTAT
jgi:hypothetical protein